MFWIGVDLDLSPCQVYRQPSPADSSLQIWTNGLPPLHPNTSSLYASGNDIGLLALPAPFS